MKSNRETLEYDRHRSRWNRKPVPDPPPPRQPRPWPYQPDETTILMWINSAVNHYIGIRASGAAPANGAPCFPVSTPAAAPQLRYAAEAAERWWPNARSFDLIAGDVLYNQSAKADARTPPDMIRLHDPVTVAAFTLTDRGPAPQPPAPPDPDAA